MQQHSSYTQTNWNWAQELKPRWAFVLWKESHTFYMVNCQRNWNTERTKDQIRQYICARGSWNYMFIFMYTVQHLTCDIITLSQTSKHNSWDPFSLRKNNVEGKREGLQEPDAHHMFLEVTHDAVVQVKGCYTYSYSHHTSLSIENFWLWTTFKRGKKEKGKKEKQVGKKGKPHSSLLEIFISLCFLSLQ